MLCIHIHAQCSTKSIVGKEYKDKNEVFGGNLFLHKTQKKENLIISQKPKSPCKRREA